MGLDVLLEILGALERLAAEVALVGLERDMHPHMRGDGIALDRRGPAGAPFAGQIEVVSALAANVLLAEMFLSIGQLIARSGDDGEILRPHPTRGAKGDARGTYVESRGTGKSRRAVLPLAVLDFVRVDRGLRAGGRGRRHRAQG
jgi:hypothetical protein